MFTKLVLFALLCDSIYGGNIRNSKPYYDIDLADEIFSAFIRNFSKSYSSEAEHQIRFQTFVQNLQSINEFNKQHDSTTFGINQYSDLSKDELSRQHGLDVSKMEPSKRVPAGLLDGVEAPDAIDWRTKNAVTPVKNQGGCGTCWTFSATGVVEGAYGASTNKLVSLSEQELVDCDTLDNGGCMRGGMPHTALKWAEKAGGFMLESAYPYIEAETGSCNFDAKKAAVKVSNPQQYNATIEEMEKLVAKAPVSIALYFSDSMSKYVGDILTPTDCGGDINHGVVIVGYGSENGKKYWIIKNSWGTTYGEKGYLRLARDQPYCHLNEYVVTVDAQSTS